MSQDHSEPQLLCGIISQLAELPVWDERRQTLFWCDILGGTIHSFHLESGADGPAQCFLRQSAASGSARAVS